MFPASSEDLLTRGLQRLELETTLSTPLLHYASELLKWNKAFNLTAITDPHEVVTHHLLDSLSIHPFLTGERILDVGTGAGFPGVPLAIANPDKQFLLVDSNHKKLRFIRQASGLLGLNNVAVEHSRIESLDAGIFDHVTSRAFASLSDFVTLAGQHCSAQGRLLAMKGRDPTDEAALLPDDWHIEQQHALHVDGLAAERCLLVLARQAKS